MVSVGNVFHTVMVGHNNSLKINCYLKKYFVEPKWKGELKEEEKVLLRMVY